MKPGTKGVLRTLCIGAVLLVVAGLAVWRLGTASGDQATLSLTGAPASVSGGGDNFTVEIRVADVTNLSAYEWQLTFDPDVVAFDGATDGGFLGSTGHGVACVVPIQPPALNLEPGNVRYACNSTTAVSVPSGVTGEGRLSTVTFKPVGDGAPAIGFACAGLGGLDGEDIPMGGNVSECGTAPSTPTPGPGDTATPAPGDTATPAPGDTATPVGPTPTPGGPTATATPVATGPTATPTPLPPGFEAVDLAAGCNPVATTYADSTPIGTIAAAVGPAGNLEALWELESTGWLGYSPAYPEASDLTAKNFLDVVFVCVTGPGALVRPIV